MDFSNWQTMLFSAQGRIRRSQYWLWAIIVGVAVAIIINVAAMVTGANAALAQTGSFPAIFWIIYAIVLIPTLYIGICLQIKRWHDRDKSGWWCLIGLIPIVGGIWAFIECGCLDGTQGPNKFGPSPKGLG